MENWRWGEDLDAVDANLSSMSSVLSTPALSSGPTRHGGARPGPARMSEKAPMPMQWVARERLHRALTNATRGRITSVTGPAGSGKSVLVSGWANYCYPDETVWLALTAADNSSSWFWRHLDDRLRANRVEETIDLLLLERAEGGSSSIVDSEMALNRVRCLPPTVLVLDNFDLIDSPDVLGGIEHLLARVPAQVRVVLVGRHHANLPLHQLRLQGELTEISSSSLRFTVDEASALVVAAGVLALSNDQVEILTERTEGWAAGLRLATLALAEAEDPAAVVDGSGADFDLVADYFDRHVIEHQPADIQAFLLRTSVLEELTAASCQAVSGRADAGEILDRLTRHNLFVDSLSPVTRRYRYHRVFLGALRRRSALEDPSSVRHDHLRAGAYFEQSGNERAAMHHLVIAGKYDRAFEIGLSSVTRQLGTWLLPPDEILIPGEIPESYFERDPFRMYALCAALLCAFRIVEASNWLRRLDRHLESGSGPKWLRARVERLWTMHDSLMLDATGVLRHFESCQSSGAGRSEERSGPDAGTSSDWLAEVDSALRPHVPALAARAHTWLGDPSAARATVDSFLGPEYQSEVGEQYPTDNPNLLGALATVAYSEGRLRKAVNLARTALDKAHAHTRGPTVATLESHLVLAGILYEYDDLAGAVAHYDEAGRFCRQHDFPRWNAAVECGLARVGAAEGRPAESLDRLRKLRHADLLIQLHPLSISRIDDLEIRIRLSLGDLEGASRLVAALNPAFRTPEILTRMDLCAGRPDRAAARLTSERQRASTARVEIERYLLLGRAHLQLGHQRSAEDAVRRAVDRGRSERYIRVFRDDASELLGMLKMIAGRFPDVYLVELLSGSETSAPTVGAQPLTLEPLTDRERELLAFLPSHHSQYEIANLMYISVNTVKTHTRALYRKLGAGSRSEAVDISRRHGLLEPGVFPGR